MVVRVILGCALAALLPLQADGAPQDPLDGLVRAVEQHAQLGIFDDVTVRLEGETAVLTGRVTSREKREGIGASAARARGVSAVRNEIGVLPPSAEDDELRYRIARSVYGHPAFWKHASRPNPPIHIIVEHGHVTLSGVVSSPSERALARSLAAGLGERSLTSRLRVGPE